MKNLRGFRHLLFAITRIWTPFITFKTIKSTLWGAFLLVGMQTGVLKGGKDKSLPPAVILLLS